MFSVCLSAPLCRGTPTPLQPPPPIFFFGVFFLKKKFIFFYDQVWAVGGTPLAVTLEVFVYIVFMLTDTERDTDTEKKCLFLSVWRCLRPLRRDRFHRRFHWELVPFNSPRSPHQYLCRTSVSVTVSASPSQSSLTWSHQVHCDFFTQFPGITLKILNPHLVV